MANTDRTLRWGILSTARILRRFVPALRTCPRSRLVAVASRDPERAAACAGRFDIPRSYGSYEALLRDPEIDVIYLPAPNHLHAPLSIQCAEAGKHVLCEKPLALSPQEVDGIAAAAARHGVHVVEAFVHLHHPQALLMREALASGAIGRLALLRGCFNFRLVGETNIRWVPGYGGGALWDLGCYPISAMLALAGAAAWSPEEVFAHSDLAPTGVDQATTGTLRFASGAPGAPSPLAHFDCSLVTPLRELLEVAGTAGSLVPTSPFRADVDGSPNGYTVHREGEAAPTVVRLPPSDPFACEVRAMEAAVLDGAPPLVPLAFSRAVAATLAALHESARSGKPVRL